MYADLSAPVRFVGYIVHNMQHGEFAKSGKRESEVGPLKSQLEPSKKCYNYTERFSLMSESGSWLRELGKAS